MSLSVDLRRAEGDGLWKAADYAGALAAYTLCADISRDKDDYARMLICGLETDPIRGRHLRSCIRAQGDDPHMLLSWIRKHLVEEHEAEMEMRLHTYRRLLRYRRGTEAV